MHYIRIGASLVLVFLWVLNLVFGAYSIPFWVLPTLALALIVPWRGMLFMCLYKAGIHKPKRRKLAAPLAKSWPAFSAFLKATQPDGNPRNAQSISLLLQNLYCYNEDVSAQIAFLQSQTADVIALCEVNSQMLNALPQLKAAYPHQCTVLIADSALGYSMTLLSKVPFKHTRTDANGRMVHYEIYHPHGTFHFVHLHPHAPFTLRRTDKRNAITNLVRHVKTPYPIVVGGDFNNVVWDVHVRGICEAQGLKSAALPMATLPAEYSLFGRTIKLPPVAPFDFVLISERTNVHTAKAMRCPNTDHFGFEVSFSF